VTDLSGNRQFLGKVVPFCGANPNRIAPSHVFNGLIAALYGSGPASEQIMKFIRAKVDTVPPPPPLHLAESLLSDPVRLRLLSEALITVLDPDHRVFPSGGSGSSPFPISLSIVSKNPSDDQLGSQLATLLDGDVDIARVYGAQAHSDVVAAVSQILGDGHRPRRKAVEDERVIKLLRSGGPLVKRYLDAVAGLIEVAVNRKHGTMSSRLVGLGRAVYLGSYLAALRSSLFFGQQSQKVDGA
jgi:hypothetical protein